jgi:hypothetical protein
LFIGFSVIASEAKQSRNLTAETVWIASAYAQLRFGGRGRRFAPRNDGAKAQ